MSRRELIESNGGKRDIRRDAKGRITGDDAGRASAQDQKRESSTVLPRGQGDTGDRS